MTAASPLKPLPTPGARWREPRADGHSGPGTELDRHDREGLARQRTSLELIGEAPATQRLRDQIARIAAKNVTVLIHGETGTGKELVARQLHEQSPRSDQPFVPVNCAELTSDAAESRLFGHRRGSFTGAIDDHKGFFEAAHRGTLFLDEVGELALPVQAKLLRALQEGEVVRFGENRPRKIDVRVVAATNRLLDREVEAGRLRADLL
jgi:anaerobic nitric oxide reductase transcription regulator